MQKLTWTDTGTLLRDEAQWRATSGSLVARTFTTADGLRRCLVMDGQDESMPIVHDGMHSTEDKARNDAELFMDGWRRIHG